MWQKYGEMSEDDIKDKVTTLPFVKEHPEADGITANQVKTYQEYAESTHIDVATYLEYIDKANDFHSDKDANGKTIKGQAKSDKVFAWLASLDIPAGQKTAIALALYAESTVSKNKTW